MGDNTAIEDGAIWQHGAASATLCGQQHGMAQRVGCDAACDSHVAGDDKTSNSSNAALSQSLRPRLCTGGV